MGSGLRGLERCGKDSSVTTRCSSNLPDAPLLGACDDPLGEAQLRRGHELQMIWL
jgi:hypothetical protein